PRLFLCRFPLILSVLLSLGNAPPSAAQGAHDLPPHGSQKPPLTADQIVLHLQENNNKMELALHKFHDTRVYRVHYTGFFGTRDAEAVVSYRYASPDHKEFVVLSQSGAKFIVNHVIRALLDGEKEAAAEEHRRRTALTAANYDFTLAE